MFWLDSFPPNEMRLNLYFEVIVAKDLDGMWIINAEAKTATPAKEWLKFSRVAYSSLLLA